ncbi:hypothetical protein ABH15_10465 [Methanoculleus taiwanensis]|uniref:Methyltransferase domain-containing protein n=1 Tax=Methanoculleus taiwanensis TaxID=1550565 RepID=A0A498H0Y6_9EURY|nr:class I SAM-dependent methyltransferase [Methanoculleus taiwanensis]RXE56482.1 hypothetical protein ABH15_10465 [Methanoculleus taiwanensis]
MYFLAADEKETWAALAREIETTNALPDSCEGAIRSSRLSAFQFYAGVLLTAKGQGDRGREWLEAAALEEREGLFSSSFLIGFLERQENRLIMPTPAFSDPRPFLHFAGVPVMKAARSRFLQQCERTLPAFDEPLKMLDIGCGDGGLTAALLLHLQETGTIREIAEVMLVDASPAMLELAEATVGKAFPDAMITTANHRIEEISGQIDRRFDLAVSSLAFHHMPLEQKRLHLARLKPWIDHFVIFELDANHDAPEVHSPEMAFSVYQSYGRLIDFIFSHDAPVDVAINCVDCFLMTEQVSLLTQRRGERTDYHMLRTEWRDLFEDVLAPDFSLQCDAACSADEYMTLFTMHYGRDA